MERAGRSAYEAFQKLMPGDCPLPWQSLPQFIKAAWVAAAQAAIDANVVTNRITGGASTSVAQAGPLRCPTHGTHMHLEIFDRGPLNPPGNYYICNECVKDRREHPCVDGHFKRAEDAGHSAARSIEQSHETPKTQEALSRV
jgi:hypothetical protein